MTQINTCSIKFKINFHWCISSWDKQMISYQNNRSTLTKETSTNLHYRLGTSKNIQHKKCKCILRMANISKSCYENKWKSFHGKNGKYTTMQPSVHVTSDWKVCRSYWVNGSKLDLLLLLATRFFLLQSPGRNVKWHDIPAPPLSEKKTSWFLSKEKIFSNRTLLLGNNSFNFHRCVVV